LDNREPGRSTYCENKYGILEVRLGDDPFVGFKTSKVFLFLGCREDSGEVIVSQPSGVLCRTVPLEERDKPVMVRKLGRRTRTGLHALDFPFPTSPLKDEQVLIADVDGVFPEVASPLNDLLFLPSLMRS